MTEFTITFDYLCPFARNANEHVVTALRDGADWDVTFLPFSLAQVHVEEDEEPIWEREAPDDESGILALQAGLAVREDQPDRFLDAHVALFAARHDDGRDIRERTVVAEALTGAGVDTDRILELVDSGKTLGLLAEEHSRGAEDHDVWGVPTFIADGRSVFVRLLDRADPADPATSRERIEDVVTLMSDFPELHEFKQADLPA